MSRKIRWSGKDQSKALGEWLYKDSTIYLDRKYNKFLELLSVEVL